MTLTLAAMQLPVWTSKQPVVRGDLATILPTTRQDVRLANRVSWPEHCVGDEARGPAGVAYGSGSATFQSNERRRGG